MTESVAARNKRNRRAGARWQSELRDGLRNQGLDVERLVLTGSEDEGDLVVRAGHEFVVLEAKAGAMHPAEFVREAQIEAAHFAQHRGIDPSRVKGVAIVKARGKNWREGYVLTTVKDYFGLDPA